MKENPEYQEKKEPKESEFKAPGEHETGYTEKSWEKPEKAIEEKGSTIDPEYREREEPGTGAFKAPGEHETGYTEKSWEKPERTMEEGKEERTGAGWETSEKKEMGYEKKKRLTRSKSERMIFGVCGGLGEYFGIDPTIVRLVFALLAFEGIGILLYLVMAIIMPQEDSVK